MCENRMYTCMCNWVTMLYSRKKKLYWGNNNKKILKNEKKTKTQCFREKIFVFTCMQNEGEEC